MRTKKLRLLVVTIAVAVAAGSAIAWGAAGTLGLGPPWGAADQTDTNQVEVSYAIKASGKVPSEALDAVRDGIEEWNAAINSREDGWVFDLVSLADASTGSSARGAPSFHHGEGHGGGPGGGKGNGKGKGGRSGGDADISIQLKKGGGAIAGSAQRTVEDGFVVAVKIQISGSAFGFENDAATIREVTMHELGHALALEHHSNEDDLMGPTVGYEGGGPSACDLDGFEEAHKWLTVDHGSKGAYPTEATSIGCEAETPDETADLAISKQGPDMATVNERFDYALTATNNGPDGATEVEVVDTLPPDVSFNSVEPAADCDELGGTVTCGFDEFASGQSKTITIAVTAPDQPTAEGQPLVNEAEVSANERDDKPGNNADTAETEVLEDAQPPDGCSVPDHVWFLGIVYDEEQRDDFRQDVRNFEQFLATLRETYCISDSQATILAFEDNYADAGRTYAEGSEANLKSELERIRSEADKHTDSQLFFFLSSHGSAWSAPLGSACPPQRLAQSFAALKESNEEGEENGGDEDGLLDDCELGQELNEFDPKTRMFVAIDCSFCGGFSDSLTAASGTIPDGGVPESSGVPGENRVVITGCAVTTECFGSDPSDTEGGILYMHLTRVLDQGLASCDGWTAPGFPEVQGFDLPVREATDGRCTASEWFFGAVWSAYTSDADAFDRVLAVQQQFRIKYGFPSLAEDIAILEE